MVMNLITPLHHLHSLGFGDGVQVAQALASRVIIASTPYSGKTKPADLAGFSRGQLVAPPGIEPGFED
jgi:hypothetical protein